MKVISIAESLRSFLDTGLKHYNRTIWPQSGPVTSWIQSKCRTISGFLVYRYKSGGRGDWVHPMTLLSLQLKYTTHF